MWKLFNRDGAERKAPAVVVGPTARLNQSAVISVPHNTNTKLTFDTVIYDTDQMAVPASNRFVIQHTGKYLITALVEFVANASGVRTILPYVNGVANANIQIPTAPAGTNTDVSMSIQLHLNAGDYVELYAYQNSGVALNAQGNHFAIAKVDGVIVSYVASGPGAIGGGWNELSANLAFVSSDGHTFVVSSDVDLTPVMPLGARIRLTHQGIVKYFIVTAVTATQLTLYGGTDYSLSAFAITAPYFSLSKIPMGFPINPLKWTEELGDTAADRTQSNPVYNTWYNIGTLKLDVPIGAWTIEYSGQLGGVAPAGETQPVVMAALSTINNGVSDSEFMDVIYTNYTVGGAYSNGKVFGQHKNYILVAKTSFYLLGRIGGQAAGPGTSLTWASASSRKTVIRAICAYL